VKALRSILPTLVLLSVLSPLFAADPGLVWKIEGDVIPPDSRSQVDLCLGGARGIVSGSTDPVRVTLGVFTDRSGRPIEVSVVEPSGNKELDARVLGCFRDAQFGPPRKGDATSYRLVRLDLRTAPEPFAPQCTVGMPVAFTMPVRAPGETPSPEMPTGSETIVCGCLSDLSIGPTLPVVLVSSGLARVDSGAVELMKNTAAERWRTPFGCTAWKVRIER
jgi:TonB family protein